MWYIFFVLKDPRNCNLRIILVWSFFCSIREKAPMRIDLWKAILLLNLLFGYYRIPKREGGRGLERLLLTSAMKIKKNQIELYHSTWDEKLSQNHLKNITWKFFVIEIYAFESCIKGEPTIYRPDIENLISQKLQITSQSSLL